MSLADYGLNAQQSKPQPGMGAMSQEQLLMKRDEIDQLLTETHLKDVNLSKELLLQLKKAKLLQQKTDDDEVPANQRAQVQNSLGTILVNLAKHQQATFTSERFKRLETAVIKVVKTLPKEAQEAFFAVYMSEAEIALT